MYITNDRWLSVAEICTYLGGIKRNVVYKCINEKNMPAHKIGRFWKFKISEIDEWSAKLQNLPDGKQKENMIHAVKKCYKCKEHKQYKEFSKNKSTSDGYSNPCRKCKTEYDSVYKNKNKKDSTMEHEIKPTFISYNRRCTKRKGIKIDTSKLKTDITEDIYKDDKGYYYIITTSGVRHVIRCWVFKCKICNIKTANGNQSNTCSSCATTYNKGFRKYTGSFIFCTNNYQILTDGKGKYRILSPIEHNHRMYKYKCNKCHVDSLYTRPRVPKTCHYCNYISNMLNDIHGTKTRSTSYALANSPIKKLDAENKTPHLLGIALQNLVEYINTDKVRSNLFDKKAIKWMLDIGSPGSITNAIKTSAPAELLLNAINNGEGIPDNWAGTPKLIETEVVESKSDDLDIDTHISERDARHEPYCNMLKEIAQRVGREAQGSILSLCGISPLIDKTRIQTWFYGSDTYIWYEIKQNVYNKIKNKAKSLNKIFGGFVNHEIHFGDILESRHNNVALLNLDLEGPGSIMTEKLMNQVESMVLSALIKRKRTGLILNTHTRGPKGMTRCKRIALWYTMLSNVESKGYKVVKPIEPVSYCNTAGSQMQLYAVAFEKTK